MSVLFCCGGGLRSLSVAAAKAAKARLRTWGWGSTAHDWPRRAAECERCPLRVVRRGVSYCGQPLLEHIDRHDGTQGCGCPTLAKAKAPDEHCPLDRAHRPSRALGGRCNCKWCVPPSAESFPRA